MQKFMLVACLFALLVTGCGRQGESTQDKPRPAVAQPQATVYVSGFVQRPGTYHVPVGTPVGEVIRLAGGLRPEADPAGVDQREAVQATMQVYVPKQGEPERVTAVPAGETPAGPDPARQSPAPQAQATARVIRGPANAEFSALERQMLEMVNQERTSRGLAPLAMDARLVRAARLKSQDMVDNEYFAHESPKYGTFVALLNSQGVTYRLAGENLAAAGSVAQAHQGLMDSPGHRRNILNPAFGKVGIGIVQNGRGLMITQEFTD